VINSSTATYSEVGAFALQLQDQTFASVDATDGTTANCTGQYVCSATLSVGRFVPDHFDTAIMMASGVPMPCPTDLPPGVTCPTSYYGFVYSGQSFTTNVIARNLAGVTTVNYDSGTGLSKNVTLTAWDAPGSTTAVTSGSISSGSTIAATSFSGGTTVSPGTPATPIYTFGTTPTSPTDIYLRATDTDGVTSLRVPANTSVEVGIMVVSGRIKVSNAYGSELSPLTLTATAQYFSGAATGWINSVTDNVTSLALAAAYNVVKNGVTTGTTAASKSPASGLLAGNLTITLAKPTGGATGTATVSPTAPGYLPVTPGTATFGVYKSNNDFIYRRESY
jgi:MSHA biogenesis protein MshQ